ncbi:MAG: threonine/homoserine/homoserine lactone efflux protein [Spirosomataceae bacterium]
MINNIFIFLITVGISFLGSVQLGPVNAMVLQTTLNKSLRAGLWVAFGGSLPEVFYASLAIGWKGILQSNDTLFKYLQLAVIPVFIMVGVITILNQYKSSKQRKKPVSLSDKTPFVTGLTLGLFNPQLLPFWLTVLVYLNTYFVIDSLQSQVAFIGGTAAGAFGILSIFAFATFRFRERLLRFFHRIPTGYFVGSIFITLAFLQLIKISM